MANGWEYFETLLSIITLANFSPFVYAQRRNVSERDLRMVGVAFSSCVSGVRVGVACSHIMATSSSVFALLSLSLHLFLL